MRKALSICSVLGILATVMACSAFDMTTSDSSIQTAGPIPTPTPIPLPGMEGTAREGYRLLTECEWSVRSYTVSMGPVRTIMTCYKSMEDSWSSVNGIEYVMVGDFDLPASIVETYVYPDDWTQAIFFADNGPECDVTDKPEFQPLEDYVIVIPTKQAWVGGGIGSRLVECFARIQ